MHLSTGLAGPVPPSAHLSVNQKTLDACALPDLVGLLADRGVGWVGLWLEPVWDLGVPRTARLLADHGLAVSSMCRATSLTAGPTPASRDRHLRALETTAELGAACLAVVPGGLPDGRRDLDRARSTARAELAWLAARAAEHGVRLALEPMHPVFAADRGVVSTLREALAWIEDLPQETVGLAIDAFHVWWDPDLDAAWSAAAHRVAGVQIGDWSTPVEVSDVVQRALPGDGHIDLARFVATARELGWDGPVEVEIFNDALARRDPAVALDDVLRRCADLV